MDGGIKLDLDNDGEVQIINEETKQSCVANMTCSYANRIQTDDLITITCSFDNKIRNVFHFKHCPAKKWHRYKHMHSPEILTDAKGCYVCGNQKQWRFKNKKSEWVCPNCHPPKNFNKDTIQIREYKSKRN